MKQLQLKYKKGWFREKPDGWKDLGKTKKFLRTVQGMMVCCETTHSLCSETVRIGKDLENGEVFRYCPLCRIKVK